MFSRNVRAMQLSLIRSRTSCVFCLSIFKRLTCLVSLSLAIDRSRFEQRINSLETTRLNARLYFRKAFSPGPLSDIQLNISTPAPAAPRMQQTGDVGALCIAPLNTVNKHV